MYIRVLLFITSCIVLGGCITRGANPQNESKNISVSLFDSKVDSILSKMTLKEKVGQLNQYSVGPELTGPGSKNDWQQKRIDLLKNGRVGSVLNLIGAQQTYEMQKMVVENSRLGIPLIFAYDVIHGYKTIMPIPLGETASWDLEAIEKSAQVAAVETAAAGIQWTFAPMVDVSRDARWGRVMEGAGEDPYLGAQVALARIKGFQGDDLSDISTIAACAKHFAAYGFVESGRDYNAVNIGTSTLMNVVVPPFEAASKAGVATFMNAFNDIDGVPSTANEYLLTELLNKQWQFDGVVVSDWNSIGEMVNHGTVANEEEASKKALEAGTHIDMEADAYIEQLESLVESKAIDIAILDNAVRRVLKLKYRLGLFDDPFKYCDQAREKTTLLSEENLETARDVARKSIVLLKNEGNLLPLKPNQKVGVIGPLANDKDSPIGNWRAAGESNSAVSFLEGINDAYGKANISFAEGCKLSVGPNNFFEETVVENNDKSGFAEAINVAKSSDVVFMVLGETAYMSGEARSRAEIGLPGLQLDLLKEVYKVNKNIVLVLMNGRPMTITWEAENVPAILETWHLGSEAGHAIADVIMGKYNPSGKLPMTFPRHVGQLPMYYNHKMTGRPSTDPGMVFYTHFGDIKDEPLYPFGYGLSYSNFDYSNLRLSNNTISENDTLQVAVQVSNTSDIEGEEVVQLYIQDMVGSVTRPVKELKRFKKLAIAANSSETVVFELTAQDLAFYTSDRGVAPESGDFKVYVGGDSRDNLVTVFQLELDEAL